MRVFKLISALIVVVAFSAVAVATASAEETLWRWLPGAVGEQFTGKSGKATLQVKGGAAITCEKSSLLLSESELTSPAGGATLALAVIHFGNKCNTGGILVNSLGDEAGIILVHVEIHNCLIKAKDYGLLIKPLELHLEVPALKTLLLVRGDIVALVTPAEKKALTFTLLIEQAAGVQAIEKCEGGVAEKLETSTNGGAFVQSGEEAKEGTITFDKVEQEVMI